MRELAIKQAKNIVAGTEQLRADVNTILAAMQAYKSPLGSACWCCAALHASLLTLLPPFAASTASSLQSLLDNPTLCLPHKDLRYSAYGGACDVGSYMQHANPQTAATSSSGASPAGSFDMPPTPGGGPPQQMSQTPNGLSAMLFGGQGFQQDDARFKEMLDFGDSEGLGSYSVATTWGQ